MLYKRGWRLAKATQRAPEEPELTRWSGARRVPASKGWRLAKAARRVPEEPELTSRVT